MSTDRPLPLDPDGSPSTSPRGKVLCGIVVISGFIAYQGSSLWGEIAALRSELSESRNSSIIGYVGINPKPSMAEPPGEWFRVEDDQVKLWGGWHPQYGHRWFLTEPNDLDRTLLTESMGRDLFQGIDQPLVERGGGPVSDRIPDHHLVDTIMLDGQPCAYPLIVLDKVLLVNDEIDGKPLLVLYTIRGEGGSSVFESVLDGNRLRMGFAGYFYKGNPLLYDRSTEGLWFEGSEGLVSLSGPYRGRVLKRLGRMERVSWGAWSQQHKESRVLIGADRTIGSTPL